MSARKTKSSSRAIDKANLRIWAPLLVIGVIAGSVAMFYFYRRAAAPVAALPPVEKSPATKTQPKQQNLAQEARDYLERRKFKPLSGNLESLLADAQFKPVPTQTHALVLQQAPDFVLQNSDEKKWSLAEQLKEGPVLLVFYYGYYCNHCIGQLFAINKDLEKFRELGVSVVA